MTSIKYRNSNGTYATLLDVTNTLSRISSLETKMAAVEAKLTIKADGSWRYVVNGSYVIGWRTDRVTVTSWSVWGGICEGYPKFPSVIYPGGYQGKFSQVALFVHAKNVGEITSCGVELEDASTPAVLTSFPGGYILRPNNRGTNVTFDLYRLFFGQLK